MSSRPTPIVPRHVIPPSIPGAGHPRTGLSKGEDAIQSAMYSAASLRIYTLGRFRVLLPERAGGDEVRWGNPQSQTLFKCLLAAPTQQLTSEQVIETLWPESDPERGRARLRDTLSKLRRVLEPGRAAYAPSTYVVSDRQSIRLLLDRQTLAAPLIWLDAQAFERLAEAALVSLELTRDGRSMADAALALYRGPFLLLERYAAWSNAARQHYHRLWTALLRRLAYTEIADRNLDRAILLLDKLTDALPDDEDAVYLSMVVHAAVRRRGEALRIYHALCQHLAEALGSQPKRELQVLSEAIRSGASMSDALARLI